MESIFAPTTPGVNLFGTAGTGLAQLQASGAGARANQLATTGNSTDMAIQGNGFFVVDDNGNEELTRAGNFTLNSSGDLVTASGQEVLGYGATNGVVDTTTSAEPINIPVGVVQQAQPTTEIGMNTNLDSTATSGTAFSTSVTVYDSLGESHNATITFTNAGSDTWDYSISLPSSDYSGTATNTTGTLTFNANGTLATPTGNVTGVTFPGLTDGASDLSINWSLYNSSGQPTISTSASASATSTTSQNGYPSGVYEGFSVDDNGVITAQFGNAQSEVVGAVALGNVTNIQGLQQVGNNSYSTTGASGSLTVGSANTGGLGTIQDGALEQSNVDISTEFANLIVAQRAFEANAKAVTTFDTVTQETIDLIH